MAGSPAGSDPGRSPAPRPVTLRAVAVHAGVSKSVVSRVLQNSPRVSPESRSAVQRAIAELGYRPNGMARSLTQRRTRAVGVIVNDLRQPWFPGLLEGLGPALGAHGLHTLVGDGRLDRTMDDRLVNALIDMRVDGLVLAGSMRPSAVIAEAVRRIPTVVAGGRDIDLPSVDVVSQDDAHGIGLAIAHLRDLGHHRIAHVAGAEGAVFEVRAAAYEASMRDAGAADALATEYGETTDVGGHLAAVRLLDLPPGRRPTAILAGNDLMAMGVLAAARERGIGVPGELSVVGFDDTYLANMRYVDLTSVHASPLEIGAVSARHLLRRIDDPSRKPDLTLVVPTLTVRGSTAPVRLGS